MSSKIYNLEELFYKRMEEGITKIIEKLGGTLTIDVRKEIFEIDIDSSKEETAAILILEYLEHLQEAILAQYEGVKDCKWIGNVGWKL